MRNQLPTAQELAELNSSSSPLNSSSNLPTPQELSELNSGIPAQSTSQGGLNLPGDIAAFGIGGWMPSIPAGTKLPSLMPGAGGITNVPSNFMPNLPIDIQNTRLPESSATSVLKQIGVPDTSETQLAQKAGEITSLLTGVGGSVYNLGKKLPFIIPQGYKNAGLIDHLVSQMPKNFTAQDLTDKATSEWFPGIMKGIENDANRQYSMASPLMDKDSPLSKVNINPYLQSFGKSPSDSDLYNLMDPSVRDAEILKNPIARQLLSAQWIQKNPGKSSIISPEDYGNLDSATKKLVDNFVSDPNAMDLKNLRLHSGNMLASPDMGDAGMADKRTAFQNLQNVTNNMMENHLTLPNNDPTNQPYLNAWRNGNYIRSTMFHPVMNNKKLSDMSSINPVTKEPYYDTGEATPTSVNNSVMKSINSSNYGLNRTHPISEINDVIQQKLAHENLPPTFLKQYGMKIAPGLGGQGLLGLYVRHLLNKQNQ